jgi:general stress protein 26
MTKQPDYFRICFSIFLLISFNSFSQETTHKDFSKEVLLNAAREIIEGTSACALITLDASGIPSVRAMDPFLPESDFTIWLGTNPKSRKVNQIKNNPKVTLYYLDKNSSGYVVIHGSAILVNDQSEKDKRWKTKWDAYYPNKTDDYQLIKISPERMEVISYAHGIIGDPATWEVPVVNFINK